MKLIIGLGNPGARYETTRHNYGYLVVDELMQRSDAKFKKHRSNSVIASTVIADEKVVLAKPQSFMNESGPVVNALKQFYKVPDEDIIICYDDIDLTFGSFRIGLFKSSGGHNGAESIITAIGSSDFLRVRLGIGPQTGTAEDFVLSQWSKDENASLAQLISKAADAVSDIITNGVEDAAQKFN